MNSIEFILYDGKYPTLCSGMLILKVLGRLYALCSWPEYMNKKYERFRSCVLKDPLITKVYSVNFMSGGRTDWTAGSWDRIIQGDWEIDGLPPSLEIFHNQIVSLFNENVEHGCCGGCL